MRLRQRNLRGHWTQQESFLLLIYPTSHLHGEDDYFPVWEMTSSLLSRPFLRLQVRHKSCVKIRSISPLGQATHPRAGQPTRRDVPVWVWVCGACQWCCETVWPPCKSQDALISVLQHTSVIKWWWWWWFGGGGGPLSSGMTAEGISCWGRGFVWLFVGW